MPLMRGIENALFFGETKKNPTGSSVFGKPKKKKNQNPHHTPPPPSITPHFTSHQNEALLLFGGRPHNSLN